MLGPARLGREPHPVIEAHGSYVFGVLVVILPEVEESHVYQEIGFVVTPERLVTVRRSSTPTYHVLRRLAARTRRQLPGLQSVLVHRLVDDVADTYLDLLDAVYAHIDSLEDEID